MELLKCTQCGAIGLEDRGDHFACPYCQAMYRKTAPQPQVERPAKKRPAAKRTLKKAPTAKARPPKKAEPQREIVYIPPKPFNRNRLLLGQIGRAHV